MVRVVTTGNLVVEVFFIIISFLFYIVPPFVFFCSVQLILCVLPLDICVFFLRISNPVNVLCVLITSIVRSSCTTA